MWIKFWKSALFYGLKIHETQLAGGGAPATPEAAEPEAAEPAAPAEPAAADPGIPAKPAELDPAGPVKPEGLEDSFWDQEKGIVKLDTLIKSHNDTRSKIHANEQAYREKFMAELQAGRPGSPDKYEINKDLGIKAPEGFEIKFENGDPMLVMWRDLAFKNNLSQEQFEEGVRTFVQANLSTRPDPAAELKKLGENGENRITRIDLLLHKHLPQEDINELADFVMTAKGVEILEKLFTGIGGSRVADMDTGDQGGGGQLTLGELRQMQLDPRYTGKQGQRDPGFIKQVEEGYAKLYPDKHPVNRRL